MIKNKSKIWTLGIIGFIVIVFIILASCQTEAKADSTKDPEVLYVEYHHTWNYKQNLVHRIAEEARSIGIEEDNPIIRECSRLWFEYAGQLDDIVLEPEPDIPDYSEDAILIAKVLYTESRGLSDEENKLVAWCILNRVDAGYGTIREVITAPYQFAYYSSTPVTERLLNIANEVLYDYYTGGTAPTLYPYATTSDYLYFNGDGYHNYFRHTY